MAPFCVAGAALSGIGILERLVHMAFETVLKRLVLSEVVYWLMHLVRTGATSYRYMYT